MRQQDRVGNIAAEQAKRDNRDLPRWTDNIRSKLGAGLQAESRVIARMQERIRRPWLDRYFLYTSFLGTANFFMVVLPALFFFGYGDFGRGLLIVLSLGAYLSSIVKDLICSPRPFAPPVTRLTIGSHHLEYGFPSTHSTNTVSAALFFFSHIHRLASTSSSSLQLPNPSFFSNNVTSPHFPFMPTFLSPEGSPSSPMISSGLYILLCTLLLIYAFSVVFGRLYTGMHSFTDCFAGVTLGTAIWWMHTSWAAFPMTLTSDHFLYPFLARIYPTESPGAYPITIHMIRGLGGGEWLESWVRNGGWEVLGLLILVCFLALALHPQLVDCPCFEDALGGSSIMLGLLLSLWAGSYTKLGVEFRTAALMPGSGWAEVDGGWTRVERGQRDIFVWWSIALLKLTVGLLTIFLWRLLAKATLHRVLPPTLRFISDIYHFPPRFYASASDSKAVPSGFHVADSKLELHPVPSIFHLPNATTIGNEVRGIGSEVISISLTQRTLKARISPSARAKPSPTTVNDRTKVDRGAPNAKTIKHRVNVITKVVVYTGIAMLGAEGIPLAFAILGWGVRSSM